MKLLDQMNTLALFEARNWGGGGVNKSWGGELG